MFIRHSHDLRAPDLRASEITPKDVYLDRRTLLAGAAGLLGAGHVRERRRRDAAQRSRQRAFDRREAHEPQGRDKLQQLSTSSAPTRAIRPRTPRR